MHYYNIQYMRNGSPKGGYYTVRSEQEYKPGDIVRLYGRGTALVIGDGDMDYAQRVGDEGLISIIGLREEERGEENG